MTEYYQGQEYPEQKVYLIAECTNERIPENEVQDYHVSINEPNGDIIVTFSCPSCGQTHRSKRVT